MNIFGHLFFIVFVSMLVRAAFGDFYGMAALNVLFFGLFMQFVANILKHIVMVLEVIGQLANTLNLSSNLQSSQSEALMTVAKQMIDDMQELRVSNEHESKS